MSQKMADLSEFNLQNYFRNTLLKSEDLSGMLEVVLTMKDALPWVTFMLQEISESDLKEIEA